jgi:hypothetical protein
VNENWNIGRTRLGETGNKVWRAAREAVVFRIVVKGGNDDENTLHRPVMD